MKLKRIVTSILATAMIAVNVLPCSAVAAEKAVPNEQSVTYDLPSLYVSRNKSETGSKMSVGLNAGESGTSNVIKLRFSGIPSDAEIYKIEIVGAGVSSSGTGLTIATTVVLTSPDGYEYENTWGVGNKITIDNLFHNTTNGYWSLYFNASNVSSSGYSVLSYARPTVTIYYRTY